MGVARRSGWNQRLARSSPTPPRPRLRRELLHLATDLAAVAENPAEVEHVFDLLSRSYTTPAADTARDKLSPIRIANSNSLWKPIWC